MLEQQRKKIEGKTIVTALINEVSRQLRQNQIIQIPNKQYMLIYNFGFDLKDDDVIILKDIFQEWLQDYLKSQVIENLTHAKDFVADFNYEISLLKSLLRYFTLLFHKYENKLGSQEIYIIEFGLTIFDTMVMNHDVIKQRYVQSYIQQINDIRLLNNNNEKQVLQSFLEILNLFILAQHHRVEIIIVDKEIIIQQKPKTNKRQSMMSPQSNYDTFLFPFVMEGTRKFYQDLSISWIQSGTSQEYVRKAAMQFSIEKELDENFYIIFSKKHEIYHAFLSEILEQRVDQIVNNPNDGLPQLFAQLRNSKDLSPITRMYNLYKASQNQIENLLSEFQIFVQNTIITVFAEQAENKQQNSQNQQGQKPAQPSNAVLHIQQIDNLQIVYEYCLLLVQTCFENSHKFRNHMELSFKEKINQVERFVEKLAMYINVSLKDKLKETNNDEDRQKFEKFNRNILAFIQFINSKGRLFQKITENLKERIFKGETKNQGFEEDFLKGLRREHPEHLPSDLLTVWKDFKFYRNLDNEISSELVRQRIIQGTNIQFTVFTRTNSLKEFNTANRKDNIKVTQFLQPAISFMEKFYQKKLQTEKKTLVWNYNIGQSVINYKFGPGPQQIGKLIVSNLQLFIILSLRQSRKGKHDLLHETGINYEEELNYQLEPLLYYNIVVVDADIYYLQTDQSKLKVKLIANKPLPLIPKKVVESSEDLQMLRKERDIKIQSSIVRLMKTNKEMIYPQLLQGVQKGLLGYYDFSAQDILAQIDELINGNYIKRDDRINNKFIYTPQ